MHKDEHVCYTQVCVSGLAISHKVEIVLQCLLEVFENTNSVITALYKYMPSDCFNGDVRCI